VTRNVYDDEKFFEAYGRLPRSIQGLDGATYVNLLLRAGFAIAHLDEWGPSPEQIASHPEWANERQRPPFLLVAARA
jgi:hypothetical protein